MGCLHRQTDSSHSHGDRRAHLEAKGVLAGVPKQRFRPAHVEDIEGATVGDDGPRAQGVRLHARARCCCLELVAGTKGKVVVEARELVVDQARDCRGKRHRHLTVDRERADADVKLIIIGVG